MKKSFYYPLAFFLSLATLLALGCSHGQNVRPRPAAKSLKYEKSVRIPKDLKVKHILKTAKDHLGIRYRFGGNTPKGTDCSGFTQLVFRMHGVVLPHSSYLQSKLGAYISRKEKLKPGDLVFFETYKKGPSHVGIYLGNSRFIHASSGQKKVIIARVDSSYYAPRYLGAKRFF